jgi:hypothetical protein
MIDSVLRRARDLYATYCASSNGLNYQGLPCPAWDALTEAVRGHWYTVALRTIELGVRDADADTPAGLAPEFDHPPTDYTLGHLPSMVHALEVWRRYSGLEG